MIYLSQTASFLFFTLVSLKTGISGCGSPFLIFLYRRYDMAFSDCKLLVLYACQSENGHIRMRQPFSYLSLQTFLCRHFRVSEKFHFAHSSHD